MAFSHLLGAFSLVVTQFQAISSYGAVLARLNALAEGLQPARDVPSGIQIVEDGDRIAYENLTLAGPDDEVLIRELTFTIPEGSRILVSSRDPAMRGALVRATAGVWDEGRGTVRRPPLEQIAFLPERPYLPPGTLREMMGASDGSVPLDDEIAGALDALGAGDLLDRADGIDVEHDWERVLTLHDQQILALARVLVARPVFAFVDDLEHIVGAARLPVVLSAFIERGITCVAFGDLDEPRADYDAVLELGEGGAWRVREPHEEPGAHPADLGGPT
jgi:putative ATP-binding cassette transporter